MIENLWILKYKVMVMLNICNLIKLKPISKNPQRFTTRVSLNISANISADIFKQINFIYKIKKLLKNQRI